MMSDPRQVLERLCAERGEDFAGLSRMLGRNPAYVQQFVRRGVPRRLGEDERRKLARYFGVAEALLGGPAEDAAAQQGLVSVKRHPVMVSAGPGALVTEELGKPYFAFDERWLKALTPTSPSNLSIVRVEGDSMAPTLNAGDDILVDLGDGAERLRDGIYVLRIDDALVVKRIALNPVGRRITVQSDNPAYPDWPDCGSNDIKPIGRVIWSGRRIVELRRLRSISQVTTASAMPIPRPINVPLSGFRIESPPRNPSRMKIVRKQPPAREVLGMRGPCQANAPPPSATWSTDR